MREAAIREVPNILRDNGKLDTPSIRQKLYARGISISIDELDDLLIDLKESRVVVCSVIPIYDNGKIISHGEYMNWQDSFDDYSSTTPIKRTDTVK